MLRACVLCGAQRPSWVATTLRRACVRHHRHRATDRVLPKRMAALAARALLSCTARRSSRAVLSRRANRSPALPGVRVIVAQASPAAAANNKMAKIEGPAWSLDDEYKGLSSDTLKKDLKFVESETTTLEARIIALKARAWRGGKHAAWSLRCQATLTFALRQTMCAGVNVAKPEANSVDLLVVRKFDPRQCVWARW